MCGRQQPWTAEVFNAIPWILTGIFIFAIIYFAVRKFGLNALGARMTPVIGRQIAIGSAVAAFLICAITWPIYEGGFWDYGGLGAMDEVSELDKLRTQPSDTLIHTEQGNSWGEWSDECLPYEESSDLLLWETLTHGEDFADYCILPAIHWVDWGIYQPTKVVILDYAGANQHSVPEIGRNGAFGEIIYTGNENLEEVIITETLVFNVEDFGIDRLPADIGCNFRTTVRDAGTHSQTLSLSDSNNQLLWSTEGGSCSTTTMYLDAVSYTHLTLPTKRIV